MTDQLQALLAPLALERTLYPPQSRYHGIAVASLETPDGQTIVYLRRRFVPPPERFALLHEHVASPGERLDHVAARYLGDPELFWRLCDANGVLSPDELTDEAGRLIRITLPEGIPGTQDG